jgi:hypothetical protein
MNLYADNTTSPFTAVICSAILFGFSFIVVNDIQADTTPNEKTANQTKVESKTIIVMPENKDATRSNQSTQSVRTQPKEPKREPVIIHHPDGSKSIEIDDSRWIPFNVEIRENGELTTSH